MQNTAINPDSAVAELAAMQHGAVSRAQLLSAGLTRSAIATRVRTERLHRIHRGVYLLGHRAAADGWREMAAVLACGDGAAISHLSAAQRWALLPFPCRKRPIDVTVQRDPGVRPGIRLHRVKSLDRRDVGSVRRIPVTRPARTLLDVAGSCPLRLFEQALAEAQVRRLATRRDLVAVLDRNRGRPGTGILRAALAADALPALTRSRAEERFLELVRSASLPSPETNVRLGPYEVDFLWRKQRLIVEVDGFQFHASRAAFERDRRRDAELQAHGFRVIRVTWRQLVGDPDATLSRTARALAAPGRA